MTTITVGDGPRVAASGIVPGRDETIDAVALLALTMIGVVGFRPAYGGHGYLAAGAAGVLLGLLLSHAGQRARLPLLAVVAASILAFLLFGGVVSQTGTVSLPTLQAITSAAVSGWQQLLTTARPVGRAAGLLVLPYLLGLFSGVAGHALARRTRTVLLPAAAPVVVVALSILFGAPQPTAAVLQGAGFAAVALAWSAVRQQRGSGRQAVIGRQRPWQRIFAGGRRARRGRCGGHGHRPAPAGRWRPPAGRARRRAAVRYHRLPESARRLPRLHHGRPGRGQRLRRGTASPPPGCPRGAGCGSRPWTPMTA